MSKGLDDLVLQVLLVITRFSLLVHFCSPCTGLLSRYRKALAFQHLGGLAATQASFLQLHTMTAQGLSPCRKSPALYLASRAVGTMEEDFTTHLLLPQGCCFQVQLPPQGGPCSLGPHLPRLLFGVPFWEQIVS